MYYYLILLEVLRYLDEHERVGLVGDDDAQLVERQAVLELVGLAVAGVQHVQRLVGRQQRALAGLVAAPVVFYCFTRVLGGEKRSLLVLIPFQAGETIGRS